MIDEVRVFNRVLTPGEAAEIAEWDPIRQILQTAADKRTAEQGSHCPHFPGKTDAELQDLNESIKLIQKERDKFDATVPTVMVMQEMEKPRDTFMLTRGEYDKKGEKVTLDPGSVETRYVEPVKNRLEMAKWLLNPTIRSPAA